MTLAAYLIVAAAVFCCGLYGVLTRRNAIGMLIGVELMANAGNINLIAFSRFLGQVDGQVFTLFAIALTVAEVVVGLALVLLLYRSRKNIDVVQASEMKG
ncbi:MAG: NADH-quinone oxidoreductase subunit NuoK [Myxococcota bacterium]|nr:NADH-quinone oxidoreductase subunit NuoK [Myxococcota bacterium]